MPENIEDPNETDGVLGNLVPVLDKGINER